MKIQLKENYFFIGLLSLIFIFGTYTLVKTPNLVSISENRTLNQFQPFTLGSFLNGTFQSNFENAFSDQFPKSEKIRTVYGETISKLPTFGIDRLVCGDRYVLLSNDPNMPYATFDCGDYILHMPEMPNAEKMENLETNINKFNHVNQLTDAYYYVINTSSTYDFKNNQRVIDYAEILSEKMQGNYKISSLEYNNYEEYKNLFYKTDHHWNYKGSYQGFLDIMKMMDIQITAPTELNTFTNHEFFFGKLSRTIRNYDYFEEFTIYTFNIPEHDVIIDGELGKKYNHLDDFVVHNYKYSRDTNFYADFYGKDYDEVIFDFHQPEKENLLLIVDSFSNPINKLIAQHFNKTYVIDTRNRRGIPRTFVLSEYLEKNNIDKTLLIMSSDFFLTETETTKGLEL